MSLKAIFILSVHCDHYLYLLMLRSSPGGTLNSEGVPSAVGLCMSRRMECSTYAQQAGTRTVTGNVPR